MNYNSVILTGMGLGNRLKNIASSLRLMKYPYIQKNDKLVIWWPLYERINTSFSSLFNIEEVPFEEYSDWVSVKNRTNYNEEPGYTYVWWRLWTEEVPSGFVSDYQKDKQDNNGALIDCEYNRIPQNVIDIYRPIFNIIKPNNEILERVSQTPLPITAMHIRNAADWEQIYRNKSIDLFLYHLNKIDGLVFLSCHSEEIFQIINKKMPGKVYSLPNKRYDSMIDATADMLLLGMAKQLYVTIWSTFSEVGWWFGGCKSQVTTVGI